MYLHTAQYGSPPGIAKRLDKLFDNMGGIACTITHFALELRLREPVVHQSANPSHPLYTPPPLFG